VTLLKSIVAQARQIFLQHLSVARARLRRAEDFHFIASGRSTVSEVDPISERHDEALEQDFDR
jgi:hypothetical protein